MTATSHIFAALGDPMRAAIVERLVRSGPASVTSLSQGLPVTRQAVTKHLRVLSDAHLVRSNRRGREQIVELQPESLSEASAWLNSLANEWDRRLALLKNLVESG